MYLITIFLLFGCSIIAAQDGEGAPCFAPNTVLTDCVNLCRNTCAEPDKEEDCDFDICHRGCDCVDGYVRDDNNICILPEECPELQCNNLNEEYDYCRQDQTCQGYFDGGPLILPLPDTCKPDCKCKLGYVRNSNLACVTPRGCCPDPFSKLRANPNPCPGGTCAFPRFSNCFMAIPPFGCQCRTGYLKVSNTNKTCVPEWWCPVADYPDE